MLTLAVAKPKLHSFAVLLIKGKILCATLLLFRDMSVKEYDLISSGLSRSQIKVCTLTHSDSDREDISEHVFNLVRVNRASIASEAPIFLDGIYPESVAALTLELAR
ncbi:hypothetical protein OUZ56_027278 [Daphnia magna]|uniref:Uncharacterized protein n=1 Tax=Daphnia magna TaxID=35525 RepID=A0ABQ9ZQ92_9CRUS|nr:hypothetical protein OUZ56_027278 [Daphnia magna]